MENFIAYHSVERQGADFQPSPRFSFFSAKGRRLVEDSLGSRVWVVIGRSEGRHHSYSVAGFFVPDSVVEDGPGWHITGWGMPLRPQPDVTQVDWFKTLREEQANFSVGYNRTHDVQVAAGLAALVPDDSFAIADSFLLTEDGVLEPDDIAREEGGRRLRLHLVTERDRSLVEAKRAAVLGATGRLACEVCEFDFLATYGERGREFCEVHHNVALSSGPRLTILADLAVLCSNCHRMAHRSPEVSLTELKQLVMSRRG